MIPLTEFPTRSRSEAVSICIDGSGTRFLPVSATDGVPERRFHVPERIDSVAGGNVVPARALAFARRECGAFVWSGFCRNWFWVAEVRWCPMKRRRSDGVVGDGYRQTVGLVMVGHQLWTNK